VILSKKKIRRDLHIFLGIVALLILIGFVFIYSSSSVYALEKHEDATYFVKRQLIGLIVGFIGLIMARLIPLAAIKRTSPLLLLVSLFLTALTLIDKFARHIHGSSRWLNIGGFAFQPSELLKIALIFYVAYFIVRKEKERPSFMRSMLPLLVILGITALILLSQPDFGLTVTLIATVVLMLFVTQYQVKYLLFLLIGAIPATIGLIIMRPYRIARVLTFLNPWADPKGSGFQIIQSLIAIGSGGIFGLGIGESKQKFFYLPMQHTDFIFSIIAEETGFVGVCVLVFLFIALLYMGLRIAWQLKDHFSTIAMIGFTLLISLQAAINLAVTTGLAPTKGIGLPFISYGNTALVCALLMVGLVMNMVNNDQ